jgi:hypothetical protein
MVRDLESKCQRKGDANPKEARNKAQDLRQARTDLCGKGADKYHFTKQHDPAPK